VKPGQGGILIGNPFTKQNKLPAPVTLEACAIVCWEHNLTVAGVEDADECYCGTAVMPNATKLPAGCKQRCTGGHEDCGGFFQIGVFAVECSGRKPSPPDPPPPQLFNNASLPLATRLDDLMSRFTKAELIAQLGGPGIGDIDRPGLRLQGASYGRECLSGVDGISVPENSTGTSAFPNPVNLGMSFDTALVEEVASAIGDEARALWNAGQTGAGGLSRGSGGLLCLSPVLNVARDPRWGRSYESYGEDPLAISRLGAAYIQGLQYGPGAAEVTMADNPRGYKKIGSVAKHLSAYNFEGCIGHQRYPYCTQYREFFDAVVSETDLQETYWQAWRHLAKSVRAVS
jgi:beta-glucosidase